MSQNKKNRYVCQKCHKSIITIDKDEGITPFMIECKATENCDGLMYSSFYDKSLQNNPLLIPMFEWYKPKNANHYPEEHREIMQKHFDEGGLDIRPIRKEQ